MSVNLGTVPEQGGIANVKGHEDQRWVQVIELDCSCSPVAGENSYEIGCSE